jgi:hypothetical protein
MSMKKISSGLDTNDRSALSRPMHLPQWTSECRIHLHNSAAGERPDQAVVSTSFAGASAGSSLEEALGSLAERKGVMTRGTNSLMTRRRPDTCS